MFLIFCTSSHDPTDFLCGKSVLFSHCVASHRLLKFCNPVPNTPGTEAALMRTSTPPFWVWHFTANLSELFILHHLYQGWTNSEPGVLQVPMVCCLDAKLYYTAISHHTISGRLWPGGDLNILLEMASKKYSFKSIYCIFVVIMNHKTRLCDLPVLLMRQFYMFTLQCRFLLLSVTL